MYKNIQKQCPYLKESKQTNNKCSPLELGGTNTSQNFFFKSFFNNKYAQHTNNFYFSNVFPLQCNYFYTYATFFYHQMIDASQKQLKHNAKPTFNQNNVVEISDDENPNTQKQTLNFKTKIKDLKEQKKPILIQFSESRLRKKNIKKQKKIIKIQKKIKKSFSSKMIKIQNSNKQHQQKIFLRNKNKQMLRQIKKQLKRTRKQNFQAQIPEFIGYSESLSQWKQTLYENLKKRLIR